MIQDPQLRTFCNEKVRQLADKLKEVVVDSADVVATYNARNLGTVINDGGAGEVIDDGATTDGRTIVVGGDVYNFITLLQNLDEFLTQGRQDVVNKWKVR